MDRTKDGRSYPLVCELLFKNPEMSVFPVAILVWWVRVDSDGDILHNPPFLSLKAFRTRKIHVNLSCIKNVFRIIHNAAAHTKSILRTKLDSSDTTDLTNRITKFGNKRARTSNRTAVEITQRDGNSNLRHNKTGCCLMLTSFYFYSAQQGQIWKIRHVVSFFSSHIRCVTAFRMIKTCKMNLMFYSV